MSVSNLGLAAIIIVDHNWGLAIIAFGSLATILKFAADLVADEVKERETLTCLQV
jgi:hypothetical protein